MRPIVALAYAALIATTWFSLGCQVGRMLEQPIVLPDPIAPLHYGPDPRIKRASAPGGGIHTCQATNQTHSQHVGGCTAAPGLV